jgi:hypothetical protein
MEKQITVKERNNWEGETFNYVIYVTPEEESQIREKCEKYGDGSLTVQESNYTDEDIKEMDAKSNNTYMAFIAPYKLKDKAVENWEEFGDCFYKGVGLKKLKALVNER